MSTKKLPKIIMAIVIRKMKDFEPFSRVPKNLPQILVILTKK